jgi:integrase
MARKNLTVRFVETVKVETRTDFWDDVVRGLVLRVSPGDKGVKSWSVVYTRESDGAKQRVTIGRFPAVSLEKARAKALGNLSAIAEGQDPAGKKKVRREAMTVKELGAIFIEKYSKRHKKSWSEDERILKVDVYPSIGDMKAVAVKKRDLLNIIDEKADAGHGAQSRQVLAVIRKMFGWAAEEDHLETSPALGIKPRVKATRRDRVLSNDELRQIWAALETAPMAAITKDVVRLLLWTGQRSGEVCGMVASEVDLEAAHWTLPGARTKNGLEHRVALSSEALAIVRARYDAADKDEPNAPLFARIDAPIESNAIAQAVRKNLQVLGEGWTPHDLRRTVATGLAAAGVAPHVIEAALNHVSGFRGGVAGVYNRHSYEPEIRRALDIWEERLLTILADKDSVVVPIRTTRAGKTG